LWKIDLLKSIAIACNPTQSSSSSFIDGSNNISFSHSQLKQLAAIDNARAEDFEKALVSVLNDLERVGILFFS
jgi:hypothetical protein